MQRNTTAHSPQIESASTSKIVTHPLAPPEPAFSDDAWFDVLIADELVNLKVSSVYLNRF